MVPIFDPASHNNRAEIYQRNGKLLNSSTVYQIDLNHWPIKGIYTFVSNINIRISTGETKLYFRQLSLLLHLKGIVYSSTISVYAITGRHITQKGEQSIENTSINYNTNWNSFLYLLFSYTPINAKLNRTGYHTNWPFFSFHFVFTTNTTKSFWSHARLPPANNKTTTITWPWSSHPWTKGLSTHRRRSNLSLTLRQEKGQNLPSVGPRIG